VPITLLSTDGTSTSCTAAGQCDDTEQTLDMTQALGMAPRTGEPGDVYRLHGYRDDQRDDDPQSAPDCHRLLVGWTPADPGTLDPFFQRMAAQGQNFFAASGDSSTWSTRNEAWPADDANIVSVGGTDLVTASAGGAWRSETAWVDSGGGISPDRIEFPRGRSSRA